MKKTYYQWLMLLMILLVFVTYWINRQYFKPNFDDVPPANERISQPVNSSMENTNKATGALTEPKVNIYKGQGFSFQIPQGLKEGDTHLVSKDPTGCGDAFGSATSCTFFNSIKNPVDNYGIGVTVFKTTDSIVSWCKEFDGTTNCNPTKINGYPAIITQSPPTETPLTKWTMISNGKILLLFSNVAAQFDTDFKTLTNSIKFD